MVDFKSNSRRCSIPGAGKLLVGTSGYSYKEWKGNFYPEKLPDREMLTFYAKQFRTVEINHSFYRMPTESALLNWAKSVPEGFRFALKANQQITHIKRLRDCASTLKRFLEVASVLNDGDHLGPILVQLPPAFLFAFEVRHPSWYTDETYAVLRQHQTALCLSETEKQTPPDVITAPFTYARLRLENYTAKQLKTWRQRLDTWLDQGIDVYVYLKHEDAGKAPVYAHQLLGKTT
jgi:uncharacterized protein YecE (DUF72 family)